MIQTSGICFISRKSHLEILHIPERCCWAAYPACLQTSSKLPRKKLEGPFGQIMAMARESQGKGATAARGHGRASAFYPNKVRPVPWASALRFITQQLRFPRNKTSPVTYSLVTKSNSTLEILHPFGSQGGHCTHPPELHTVRGCSLITSALLSSSLS